MDHRKTLFRQWLRGHCKDRCECEKCKVTNKVRTPVGGLQTESQRYEEKRTHECQNPRRKHNLLPLRPERGGNERKDNEDRTYVGSVVSNNRPSYKNAEASKDCHDSGNACRETMKRQTLLQQCPDARKLDETGLRENQ